MPCTTLQAPEPGPAQRRLQVTPNRGSNNQQEEIALVRRIAQRDEEALALIYQRYGTPIFSLACQILSDRMEAEEVLQDVFVRLWKHAKSYDPDRAAPFTWLVRITRGLCIDRLRSRRSRLSQTGNEPVTEDPQTAIADTRQKKFQEETKEQITERMSQLPEDQRVCIQLAYFGGLTQQEISEKLGEPLGTVKARIRRGMLKMRDLMEENINV